MRIVTVNDISLSTNAIMFRQLFYDIMFNNETLPPLEAVSSPFALYALLSFMISRVNAVESISINDITKINSFYKDISSRLITMLKHNALSQTAINELYEYLSNEHFFIVFIRELVKCYYTDGDCLNCVLALSDVRNIII
jgi:hypothetical protein